MLHSPTARWISRLIKHLWTKEHLMDSLEHLSNDNWCSEFCEDTIGIDLFHSYVCFHQVEVIIIVITSYFQSSCLINIPSSMIIVPSWSLMPSLRSGINDHVGTIIIDVGMLIRHNDLKYDVIDIIYAASRPTDVRKVLYIIP